MTHAWHDAYRHPAAPAHHLDPRSKLFIALVFCGSVLCSARITRNQVIAYVALLAICGLLAQLSGRAILGRLATLGPFVVLMAISAAFSSVSTDHLMQTLTKSCLCIAVMAIATMATPFPDFLRALQEVRLPKILILFLAFVYRYVAVLGDEVTRMERGWSARYFGRRPLLQWRRMGDVVAALLIRSYERAERVYAAMLARGFSEQSSLVRVLHYGRADAAFVFLSLAALIGVRWGLA